MVRQKKRFPSHPIPSHSHPISAGIPSQHTLDHMKPWNFRTLHSRWVERTLSNVLEFEPYTGLCFWGRCPTPLFFQRQRNVHYCCSVFRVERRWHLTQEDQFLSSLTNPSLLPRTPNVCKPLEISMVELCPTSRKAVIDGCCIMHNHENTISVRQQHTAVCGMAHRYI